MYDNTDSTCRCELAQYIDDDYICRYTGKQCIYNIPSENICANYYAWKRDLKKYLERGRKNA